MKIDKRTAIVVAVSTAISFVGDMLIYSIGESKDQSFKLKVPEGAQLGKVLAVGFFTGIVIDAAVKQIETATSTPQEQQLIALLEAERERIAAGQREKMIPTSIVWAPQT